MPSVATDASGQTVKARYSYLADGTKLSVRDAQNDGLSYRGSFVYTVDGTAGSTGVTEKLESIAHDEGRFVALSASAGATTTQFIDTWHIRDHLGSVRTVLDITRDTSEVSDPTLAILEQNDYLPFGTRIDLDSLAYDQSNRYRFNGKEEQVTGNIGLTDYGARFYDCILPRWTTPDPLAEKYYGISPYAFCNNNPVNFVDPDGMRIVFTNNSIEYQWKEVEGVWEFYDEDNNQINKNLFIDMVSSYLSELMTINTGSSLVKELVEHSESVYIVAVKNGYDSSKKAVGFNPINVESVPVEGGMNSDFSATFIHELAHALYDISGGETKQWFTVPQGETHVENKFRAENELPLRTYYAKNEYNQPYGPPIVAPGTRQRRYYKSDGTTNYKILKRKETPYEY